MSLKVKANPCCARLCCHYGLAPENPGCAHSCVRKPPFPPPCAPAPPAAGRQPRRPWRWGRRPPPAAPSLPEGCAGSCARAQTPSRAGCTAGCRWLAPGGPPTAGPADGGSGPQTRARSGWGRATCAAMGWLAGGAAHCILQAFAREDSAINTNSYHARCSPHDQAPAQYNAGRGAILGQVGHGGLRGPQETGLPRQVHSACCTTLQHTSACAKSMHPCPLVCPPSSPPEETTAAAS